MRLEVSNRNPPNFALSKSKWTIDTPETAARSAPTRQTLIFLSQAAVALHTLHFNCGGKRQSKQKSLKCMVLTTRKAAINGTAEQSASSNQRVVSFFSKTTKTCSQACLQSSHAGPILHICQLLNMCFNQLNDTWGRIQHTDSHAQIWFGSVTFFTNVN